MKHQPYTKGWLPARAASNACQQQTDAMFDDLNGCIERAKAFRAKMDAAAVEKLAPPVVRVPAWEVGHVVADQTKFAHVNKGFGPSRWSYATEGRLVHGWEYL